MAQHAPPEKSHAYLYLIREREFILTGHPVQKLGMTVQNASVRIRRLDGYKKGSEVFLVIRCPMHRVNSLEQEAKRLFRTHFHKHSDGTEYFAGDPYAMVKILAELVNRAWDTLDDEDTAASEAFTQPRVPPELVKLTTFIDEKCTTGDRLYINTTHLLQAFNKWDGEEVPLSTRALAVMMNKMGFKKKRVREGKDLLWAYMGIRVGANANPTSEPAAHPGYNAQCLGPSDAATETAL